MECSSGSPQWIRTTLYPLSVDPHLALVGCSGYAKPQTNPQTQNSSTRPQCHGDVLAPDPSQRDSLDITCLPTPMHWMANRTLLGSTSAKRTNSTRKTRLLWLAPLVGPIINHHGWMRLIISETVTRLTTGNCGASVATSVMHLDEDHDYSLEERNALLKQWSVDQTDDMEFADELAGKWRWM